MGKKRISQKHQVGNWFFHILEGNSKESVPKIFNYEAPTGKYTDSLRGYFNELHPCEY